MIWNSEDKFEGDLKIFEVSSIQLKTSQNFENAKSVHFIRMAISIANFLNLINFSNYNIRISC